MKYIAYLRVSTEKQGRSGLGLESQKAIILNYVQKEDVVQWFVEAKSGKNLDVLPELNRAKEYAKTNNCVLIIAKTDRLRNTQQALDLVDELTPEGVFFCNIGRNADKFLLTIFFAFAEKERLEISIRTKAALAVLKAKGVRLGRYTHKAYKSGGQYNPDVEHIRQWSKAGNTARRDKSIENENNKAAVLIALSLKNKGLSLKCITENINQKGLKTPTGKAWIASSVYRLLKRYEDCSK